MNDNTHALLGMQRLVRSMLRMASRVARQEVANSRRLGTVTQVSPLLVLLDGATTASSANKLTSYTPTVNDRVVVDRFGSQLLVLGTWT